MALESILDYSKSDDVDEDDMISLIALFDHEEIGSRKCPCVIVFILASLNHCRVSCCPLSCISGMILLISLDAESTHGAGSPVMSEAVSRITSAFGDNSHSRDPETHSSAVRRSFILSVDQAHAVHPNYAGKHEKNHGPKMNAGVVIKTNQNQRCKCYFI